MTRTAIAVQRPTALEDIPVRRFWGEKKPPKNRAEMFSTSRHAPTAAVDDDDAAAATPVAGGVATLRMYGPIDSWGGWWGISARDVSEALDALGDGVGEIRVRINSPGGEAWEGLAILNMLRAHPARIVAVVDGIAASAASFIAAGCDETVMSPGTQMMIHDASTFAWGDAKAMRKSAEFLDSVSDSIASLYTEAAGGTDDAWRTLMVEETWYTAAEAVTAGLAGRVAVVADEGSTSTAGDEPDPADDDDVEDRFDLSIFNYAGRTKAPAPALAAGDPTKPPPAPAAGSSTTKQEGSPAVAFSDEGTASLREKLGLSDDASEEAILAALDEALAEDAADAQPTTDNRAQGTVVLDAEQHATLLASAEAGRVAREQQLTDQRQAAVNAAVADGRIPPARREHWLAQLTAVPGAAAVLDGLAKGTVPLAPLGYDGDVDAEAAGSATTVRDSAAYKNWS